MTDVHTTLMQRAIDLAHNSLYLSEPNPRVGCVIARDGAVIAEGWTQRAGQAHAEIHALNSIKGQAKGTDVYVTLEPCSHHGRTGPCVDALIEAGVARVFAAMQDPNPKVKGEGFRKLKAAGIEVVQGLCEDRVKKLNPGFIRRMQTGRPLVRAKIAASLDGRTANGKGESKWITGEAARQDVQHWRGRSGAIVTGIGTVLADDPSMNVRLDTDVVQPLRVITDSSLRTPENAKILNQPGMALLVASAQAAAEPRHDVEVWQCGDKHVSLSQLVDELGRRSCNEVLIEAGATLTGAFLKAGLVDELVIYFAPLVIGETGRAMFDLQQVMPLADSPRFEFSEVKQIASDIRVIARKVKQES